MLDKEFVPYEESLILKELGFDEPCFGFYQVVATESETISHLVKVFDVTQSVCRYKDCIAPTFSQAFRWFREKYKLKGDVIHATSNGGYTYTIWKWNFDNNIGKWERIGVINSWFTYEEAELACLRKLIEIVKK